MRVQDKFIARNVFLIFQGQRTVSALLRSRSIVVHYFYLSERIRRREISRCKRRARDCVHAHRRDMVDLRRRMANSIMSQRLHCETFEKLGSKLGAREGSRTGLIPRARASSSKRAPESPFKLLLAVLTRYGLFRSSCSSYVPHIVYYTANARNSQRYRKVIKARHDYCFFLVVILIKTQEKFYLSNFNENPRFGSRISREKKNY